MMSLFSVYGRLSEKGNRQMVQLNFTDVFTRKCSDVDYQIWTVFEKVIDKEVRVDYMYRLVYITERQQNPCNQL